MSVPRRTHKGRSDALLGLPEPAAGSEPEETKETWPKFQQRLHVFEANQSEPDLSRPTADFSLSNLERQGFEKPDATNTWKQELNTGLHNKNIFDMHPINPQEDTKPTGCCEFWLCDADLVTERKPAAYSRNRQRKCARGKQEATTVTYVSEIGATMDVDEPKEPKKRAQTKQATAFVEENCTLKLARGKLDCNFKSSTKHMKLALGQLDCHVKSWLLLNRCKT
eukprot:243392-Pelagomonas_calceolata.AAC.1